MTAKECGMIETCSVTGNQRECGKFTEYQYKDGEHCICRECWESLDDDIAAEYVHLYPPIAEGIRGITIPPLAPRVSLPVAPPLPTTTTFCGATIPLFDGLEFFVDGNSKITGGNGTYAEPKPNAFSLPAASVLDGLTREGPPACPGSTPTCRGSCYVKGFAQHAPEVYAHYTNNAEALRVCFESDQFFYRSALKLAQWIEENAPHGFRWHVSGDVLNLQHAAWIREVCALAAPVDFWIYTRTLEAVPILVTAFNLAVNVSADADNYADALAVATANGARVCYLTETAEHDWREHEAGTIECARCGIDGFTVGSSGACLPRDLPPDSVIFPDYALRGRSLAVPTDAPWWQGITPEQRRMVCPTDFFGQSEAHRCGPCTKCF